MQSNSNQEKLERWISEKLVKGKAKSFYFEIYFTIYLFNI